MEGFPFSEQPSDFDRLVEAKRAEGWDYVGTEHLRETRFESGTAKFVEVSIRTEEEIRVRQRERLDQVMREAGGTGEVEVDLVAKPGEVFDGVEIPDKFGTFYVFARIKR